MSTVEVPHLAATIALNLNIELNIVPYKGRLICVCRVHNLTSPITGHQQDKCAKAAKCGKFMFCMQILMINESNCNPQYSYPTYPDPRLLLAVSH